MDFDYFVWSYFAVGALISIALVIVGILWGGSTSSSKGSGRVWAAFICGIIFFGIASPRFAAMSLKVGGLELEVKNLEKKREETQNALAVAEKKLKAKNRTLLNSEILLGQNETNKKEAIEQAISSGLLNNLPRGVFFPISGLNNELRRNLASTNPQFNFDAAKKSWGYLDLTTKSDITLFGIANPSLQPIKLPISKSMADSLEDHMQKMKDKAVLVNP